MLLANLSLDLDNSWAYLRAAGHNDWDTHPGYFHIAIPRIVALLDELNLPLTTFVVGRDLELDQISNIQELATLQDFEFGNHSFNHLPWLHTLPHAELTFEIDRTNELIKQKLGMQPIGFRGPGFSCPPELLSVLAARGFLYDASTFPTSVAPLARAYFMLRSRLNAEQKAAAAKLYGGWTSAFKPNKPFIRQVEQQSLWELPVTVMPLTRTPIHFSYFTFLASFSKVAAKAYFKLALALCRATTTPLSLLLHPPDFMTKEDEPRLSYLPGMKLPLDDKLDLIRWALRKVQKHFKVLTMRQHVEFLSAK